MAHHQYYVRASVGEEIVASNVVANLMAICGQEETKQSSEIRGGDKLYIDLREKDEAALLLAATLNIPFVLYYFDNMAIRNTKIANLVKIARGRLGERAIRDNVSTNDSTE